MNCENNIRRTQNGRNVYPKTSGVYGIERSPLLVGLSADVGQDIRPLLFNFAYIY